MAEMSQAIQDAIVPAVLTRDCCQTRQDVTTQLSQLKVNMDEVTGHLATYPRPLVAMEKIPDQINRLVHGKVSPEDLVLEENLPDFLLVEEIAEGTWSLPPGMAYQNYVPSHWLPRYWHQFQEALLMLPQPDPYQRGPGHSLLPRTHQVSLVESPPCLPSNYHLYRMKWLEVASDSQWTKRQAMGCFIRWSVNMQYFIDSRYLPQELLQQISVKDFMLWPEAMSGPEQPFRLRVPGRPGLSLESVVNHYMSLQFPLAVARQQAELVLTQETQRGSVYLRGTIRASNKLDPIFPLPFPKADQFIELIPDPPRLTCLARPPFPPGSRSLRTSVLYPHFPRSLPAGTDLTGKKSDAESAVEDFVLEYGMDQEVITIKDEVLDEDEEGDLEVDETAEENPTPRPLPHPTPPSALQEMLSQVMRDLAKIPNRPDQASRFQPLQPYRDLPDLADVDRQLRRHCHTTPLVSVLRTQQFIWLEVLELVRAIEIKVRDPMYQLAERWTPQMLEGPRRKVVTQAIRRCQRRNGAGSKRRTGVARTRPAPGTKKKVPTPAEEPVLPTEDATPTLPGPM